MIQAETSRHDPTWYTPGGLPEQLTCFGSPVRGGLDVGAVGKVGLLELTVVPCGGATRVQRQYQQAPLHVYHPIYLDSGRPEMAFMFIQQSGDGFVQGDRYRVDIDCGPGSAVHVTTQSPTKVFAAHQNFVTQLVHLRVGAGAVLEYLPDPIVPCRGSRLFQRTTVTADQQSSVILGETLLPGRVAHGEAHAYDVYWAETEVRRPDGTLLFTDLLRLDPADGEHPRSIGLLGPHDVIATLYLITSRKDPIGLVALLRRALGTCRNVLAGVSQLPNECGAVVRVLGPTSKSVQVALRTAWGAARLPLLGAPAPNLRKG